MVINSEIQQKNLLSPKFSSSQTLVLPRYPTIIHKHVAYPHVPGAGAVGAVGRGEDVRLPYEDAAAKELPAAVVQAGRPGELPVARVGAAHDPVGGVPAVDAALARAPQGAVKATPVGQE